MNNLHLSSAKELEKRFFASLDSIIQGRGLVCQQTKVAVAYSGGLDSSVLLALSIQYARQRRVSLFAYHVNHGLSPNASQWVDHCIDICGKAAVVFRSELVHVRNRGQGIEAVARSERYSALGRMCIADGVDLLLTGHHLDDQAETMLMQLFRGTGLGGLSGMDASNVAPGLLGSSLIALGRPLLGEPRIEIQRYADQMQLSNVEDESNTDICFRRNAIRQLVMPSVEQCYPGFAGRLARTAVHIRSAQRLLDELAEVDLQQSDDKNALKLEVLRGLSRDRVNNVFRYWLSKNQVQLPSTAKMEQLLCQLFSARDDARISIRHGNHAVCRYDQKIHLQDLRLRSECKQTLEFRWSGEDYRYFPELKGKLIFQNATIGVDAQLLRQSVMSVRQRPVGERLRLAKNRPSRDLKSHFQSCKIPFWLREQLPYIYIDERLFFVGLVGIDASFLSELPSTTTTEAQKVQLIWQPDQHVNQS